MNLENFNKKHESEPERVKLALEIIESNEKINFPGLNTESLEKLRVEEKEYPGFATLIDEIIIKCENQGLKIEIGNNPDGSNMFLLPFNSDNLDDSLRFKHLDLESIDNDKFKKLAGLLLK